jgi:hypothetical protein
VCVCERERERDLLYVWGKPNGHFVVVSFRRLVDVPSHTTPHHTTRTCPWALLCSFFFNAPALLLLMLLLLLPSSFVGGAAGLHSLWAIGSVGAAAAGGRGGRPGSRREGFGPSLVLLLSLSLLFFSFRWVSRLDPRTHARTFE